MGFRGVVEEGGVYAIEPFNTTGASGLIENIGRPNSSNIYRVTGLTTSRKASKKSAETFGCQMARNLEERYSTLPFAERWAFPMLKTPFPEADEASLQSKWNALVKKLISIRFLGRTTSCGARTAATSLSLNTPSTSLLEAILRSNESLGFCLKTYDWFAYGFMNRGVVVLVECIPSPLVFYPPCSPYSTSAKAANVQKCA